ncbi:hypothetical protein DLAC_08277 [Tieghemostelium lacteum]|uniref:Uncharacterized protein n=1 Tax=Tieghemostelium lacteum TaxID=361077 RepID=A0A151ZBK8_TIELA|nr:hypothetical protein DLAC_08277 [Tieghemostelium lacteum]|eukprot:KYQ91330.1 hypothetical protein DLAC_08277 [Tieghemostelium lacteum]
MNLVNSILFRNAQGRTSDLGNLYNAVTDNLISTNIVTGTVVKITTPTPKFAVDFIFDDTSALNLLVADSSMELKLSLISGLLDGTATDRFTDFVKKFSLGSDSTVLNGFILVKASNEVWQLDLTNAQINNAAFNIVSTHFIDQIHMGGHTLIYFAKKLTPIEDRIDVKNKFTAVVNSWISRGSTESSSDEYTFLSSFSYAEYNNTESSSSTVNIVQQSLKNIQTFPSRTPTAIQFRLASISDLYTKIGSSSPKQFIVSSTLSFRPEITQKLVNQYHQRENIFLQLNQLNTNLYDLATYLDFNSLSTVLETLKGYIQPPEDTLKIELQSKVQQSRLSSSYQGLVNFDIDYSEMEQFLNNQDDLKRTIHFILYLQSKNVEIQSFDETKEQFVARYGGSGTLLLLDFSTANSDVSLQIFKLFFQISQMQLNDTKFGALCSPTISEPKIEVFVNKELKSIPTSMLARKDVNLVINQNPPGTLTVNDNLLVYGLMIQCPCKQCTTNKLKWTCFKCGKDLKYRRKNLYCDCGSSSAMTSKFYCKQRSQFNTIPEAELYQYVPYTIDINILYLTKPINIANTELILKTMFSSVRSKTFKEAKVKFNGFDDLFINKSASTYSIYSTLNLQVFTSDYNLTNVMPNLKQYNDFDVIVMGDPILSDITSLSSYLLGKNLQNNVLFCYSNKDNYNSAITNLPTEPAFKDITKYYYLDTTTTSKIIEQNPDTSVTEINNATYIVTYDNNTSVVNQLFNRAKTFLPFVPS